MAKIIENRKLSEDFYLMKIEQKNNAGMGQFYMLRAWDKYPLLSRPISVYDADENTASFLYKVIGQGTELFAALKPGDDIQADGPLGNGFPEVKGKIALVGGGVGIAPLYLATKTLKKYASSNVVDNYLGFSGEALLVKEFEEISDKVAINVGGFITDNIDPTEYDFIMTCGPEIMMKILHKKCKDMNAKAPLYISMESRMGCGIGACLVCTCKTKAGNKRICKDGPIMLGNEVFGDE